MKTEKVFNEAVLCYLCRDRQVLLALKTEKIGAGCWNGYGGVIEPGETTEECAVREQFEESGIELEVNDLVQMAKLHFTNSLSDCTSFHCIVHAFVTRKWRGTARESETMIRPTWFDFDNLPLQMMPADRVWLPLVLAGQKLIAKSIYGPFQKTLLCPVHIDFVESFKRC